MRRKMMLNSPVLEKTKGAKYAGLDSPLLVFTDVDGTLCDSHTGNWHAAAGWLERLRQHHIPVILCSSKTAAEMIDLQKHSDFRDCRLSPKMAR